MLQGTCAPSWNPMLFSLVGTLSQSNDWWQTGFCLSVCLFCMGTLARPVTFHTPFWFCIVGICLGKLAISDDIDHWPYDLDPMTSNKKVLAELIVVFPYSFLSVSCFANIIRVPRNAYMSVFHHSKSPENKDLTPIFLVAPPNSMQMSVSSLWWGHWHPFFKPFDFTFSGNTDDLWILLHHKEMQAEFFFNEKWNFGVTEIYGEAERALCGLSIDNDTKFNLTVTQTRLF